VAYALQDMPPQVGGCVAQRTGLLRWLTTVKTRIPRQIRPTWWYAIKYYVSTYAPILATETIAQELSFSLYSVELPAVEH
jgi:hypothetical protein